jgi:hypothetical protein
MAASWVAITYSVVLPLEIIWFINYYYDLDGEVQAASLLPNKLDDGKSLHGLKVENLYRKSNLYERPYSVEERLVIYLKKYYNQSLTDAEFDRLCTDMAKAHVKVHGESVRDVSQVKQLYLSKGHSAREQHRQYLYSVRLDEVGDKEKPKRKNESGGKSFDEKKKEAEDLEEVVGGYTKSKKRFAMASEYYSSLDLNPIENIDENQNLDV